MFCPKCGTSNPDGAKSCMSCQCSLDMLPGSDALAPDEIIYAGFWERFAALFIDNLVLSGMMTPVFFIIGIIAGIAGVGESSGFLAGVYLLSFSISATYYTLMESGERGATLGKRLLKLRVVDTNNSRIGKGRALWRWTAHALSFITLLIGYLIQPFTARKQALHDLASGTMVVKTEKGSNTIVIVIAAVAMFFFALLLIGIVAAVAIPAYMDYGIKAKAAGAMQIGQQATMAVEEYYIRTGRIPASLAETETHIQLPSFLSKVEINPDTGEVQVTFSSNQSSSIADQSLLFTPSQEQDGHISWKCHSEEIRASLLPASCR